MPMSLPLAEMTTEEKLQAMDALWDDLCANPGAVESPAWHEEILRDRDRRIDSGESRFVSWEQAKAVLRQRIP